jgi:predicted DNA-binding protein
VYHIVTRKKVDEDTDDDEPEKKERVIHTRVPESLEAHLRERAQELGMSVSNLVRNVIGHAFGLVGDVAADSHAIARAARGEAKKSAANAPAITIDDVIGWQNVVLNKNAVCAKCNAILAKGKDAAIGAGTTIVICPACLKDMS